MSRRIALAILTAALVLAGCSTPAGSGSPGGSPAAQGRTAAPTTAPATAPIAPPGFEIVTLADLPPEAAATVRLIEAGGPFPYRQDGATFENREGLLPEAPRGTYREYTVPTPGEDDRGARRIVTGADGALYWTADHYASFAWIDR